MYACLDTITRANVKMRFRNKIKTKPMLYNMKIASILTSWVEQKRHVHLVILLKLSVKIAAASKSAERTTGVKTLQGWIVATVWLNRLLCTSRWKA